MTQDTQPQWEVWSSLTDNGLEIWYVGTKERAYGPDATYFQANSEWSALRAQKYLNAQQRRLVALEAALREEMQAVSFLRSCILSGEDLTPADERSFTETRQRSRAALLSPSEAK